MSSHPWTIADMPRLDGKVIVVTGANSGIGLEAARALAGAGAKVVLACRNETAAADAIAQIRAEHPSASLESGKLDLASLASVRAFADAFSRSHARLDVLVNNAGVMALPYGKTEDGLERQTGTNHFGHFALTGLLLGLLAQSAPSRVVTVSSVAHTMGTMDWDDLHFERSYQKWRAYGRSKLMNLLFAYELDRRLRARGLDVRSVACHPGYASTNLQLAAPRSSGSTFGQQMWRVLNGAFAQSAARGALPTLFAATSEAALGGDFIGPSFLGMWGHPVKGRSNVLSHDPEQAARLWDISERLTNVSFDEAFTRAARAA